MKIPSLIWGLLGLLALTAGCTTPWASIVRQPRTEPTHREVAADPAPSVRSDVKDPAPIAPMRLDETANGPPIDRRDGVDISPKSAREFIARGNERAGRGRIDESIADFDEAIRLDPKEARAYVGRAIIRLRVGRLDGALSDADEAIRLDSAFADAFATRAGVRIAKGNIPKALGDFDAAIRLDPENAPYYESRSSIRLLLGDWDGALKDLNTLLRLTPGNTMARRQRSSILTTCPDARYRDGKRAVADAKFVCEETRWKDREDLEALAAAHAEAGEFAEAVESEKRALDLPGGDAQSDARSRRRLQLYSSRAAHAPGR